MNLQELRTEVRNMLDEPDDMQSFFSNDEIDSWLNQAQFEIAKEAKHLKNTSYILTTDGVTQYELPDDCMEVFKATLDKTPLSKVSLEDKEHKKGYYEWEDDLHLSFNPGEDLELKVWYYYLPWPMEKDTDEPEVPEEYQHLLILYAVYKAKQKDRQYNEAEIFKRDFMEGLYQMKKQFSNAPRKRRWTIKRW